MLKLINCGLDFGNGLIKICIDDKVSKIPNCYSKEKPKGQLTNKLVERKPLAFSLLIGKETYWFGQDILGNQVIREIDTLKYKPDYIRMLFKAVLYRWLDQHHKIGDGFLVGKRLNITVGMPPEWYQNRQLRNKAEKVFSQVFNQNKPDYIHADSETISFYTSFASIQPETLIHRSKGNTGYILICDFGYGTTDFILFHSDQENPISTVSQNNGLVHAYEKINVVNPSYAELEVLRRLTVPEVYINTLKMKVVNFIRILANQQDDIHLIIIGGGAQLLSNEDKSDLKGLVSSIKFGDEFSNVRKFGAAND